MMAGTEAAPKERRSRAPAGPRGRPAILEAGAAEPGATSAGGRGKPCLRRLAAPRPRPTTRIRATCFGNGEKTNRAADAAPRLANDAVSFDKLRLIRRGMAMAYAIVELQPEARGEEGGEACGAARRAARLQMKLEARARARRSRRSSRRARSGRARAPLSPDRCSARRPTVLPMSQVEIVMRPTGTFGSAGRGSRAPAAPARGDVAEQKNARREEQMALQMAAKGYDPRGAGGMGAEAARSRAPLPLRRGRARALTARARAAARGALALAAMDGRGPPMRAAGSPGADDAVPRPPSIPDIEMIFAKNPEHAGLRRSRSWRRTAARPQGARREGGPRRRPRPQGPHHARAVRGRRLGRTIPSPWSSTASTREHTPMASVRATTRAGRGRRLARRREREGRRGKRDAVASRRVARHAAHIRSHQKTAPRRSPRSRDGPENWLAVPGSRASRRPPCRPSLLSWHLANIGGARASLIPYAPAPAPAAAGSLDATATATATGPGTPRSRLSSYRSESRDDRSPPYGWNRPSSLPPPPRRPPPKLAVASAATAAAVVAAVSPAYPSAAASPVVPPAPAVVARASRSSRRGYLPKSCFLSSRPMGLRCMKLQYPARPHDFSSYCRGTWTLGNPSRGRTRGDDEPLVVPPLDRVEGRERGFLLPDAAAHVPRRGGPRGCRTRSGPRPRRASPSPRRRPRSRLSLSCSDLALAEPRALAVLAA